MENERVRRAQLSRPAHALGAIRTLEAAKVLVMAKPAAVTQAAVADASLACAETLLAAGNKGAAKATYDKVLANSSSKMAKEAATRGLQACAGK